MLYFEIKRKAEFLDCLVSWLIAGHKQLKLLSAQFNEQSTVWLARIFQQAIYDLCLVGRKQGKLGDYTV